MTSVLLVLMGFTVGLAIGLAVSWAYFRSEIEIYEAGIKEISGILKHPKPPPK